MAQKHITIHNYDGISGTVYYHYVRGCPSCDPNAKLLVDAGAATGTFRGE
jgi:hypothetical protein